MNTEFGKRGTALATALKSSTYKTCNHTLGLAHSLVGRALGCNVGLSLLWLDWSRTTGFQTMGISYKEMNGGIIIL